MVRSLVDGAGLELANQIASLFALSGMVAVQSRHYPGWRPNPDSPLTLLCTREIAHS